MIFHPPDVLWPAPSGNSRDSMPIGNGDLGANVWVAANGDLVFYVSKADAWDEVCRQVKLARVRVQFSPPLVRPGAAFAQRLRVEQGEIEIAGPDTTVRFWVDARQPVIRVEAQGFRQVSARIELRRPEPQTLTGTALGHGAYGMEGAPHPVGVGPDTVWQQTPEGTIWFHRNEQSIWRETQELQSLPTDGVDPLWQRTFGGLLTTQHQGAGRDLVSLYVLTAQTRAPADWVRQLETLARHVDAVPLCQARTAHYQWWQAFWQRSWIQISGTPAAERVGHAYAWQRYMLACAGRGAYPIKFNGSLFTADWQIGEQPCEPDYRAWGGPYWFQNTRLVYWPMLAAGDYDLLQPLFRMYMQALPLARARTKKYFGHAGACFPETMYFWGAYANTNYGWNRAGKTPAEVDNGYIRYYWSGALELCVLMLDCQAHTQDETFRRETLLPFAEEIVRFYDQHYPRDGQGRLLIKPAGALETWHTAVNPLPEIAGLRYVLDRLLALQPHGPWDRLRAQLPPLPERTDPATRKSYLLPAVEYGNRANAENVELYAVFPYRLIGVGKPELAIGCETFARRSFPGHTCWGQDQIHAALLGLTEEARDGLEERFAAKATIGRFPAMWGPAGDWPPDQDHGGAGMLALQLMLVQSDDRVIRLLPAWPKDWDVDFKLHAPFRTTLEGAVRNGKLEHLLVTPAERAGDVQFR